jgi:hypothetical protein
MVNLIDDEDKKIDVFRHWYYVVCIVGHLIGASGLSDDDDGKKNDGLKYKLAE